jgi:4-amino-4-deoxy-L-arabinose transferase-like glycosyltransferase
MVSGGLGAGIPKTMSNSGATLGYHQDLTQTQSAENQIPRFLVLALLSAVLLFVSLRGRGLAGYDDSYFAHEAKEMVRTGDWWSVHFNGEPVLAHPPLFPWLVASSFKLFGMSDVAAKLPSALLGLGTILLTYFLTLELTGQAWLSLFAMLALASTQFFIKIATHAMTDVPFTFLFTMAIFFYVKGLTKSEFLTFLGLPLGLALLTRSVVGLLALGIILAHLVLTKRFRALRSPWLICGVALALALPSVWYASQYQLHGAAFLASHAEFLNSKIQVAPGAGRWTTIFNYPLALLKYYWPWLPFLVVGFVIEVRAALREKDQTAMLLIVWVLAVIIPFSFAATRYPRYILPVFPAFSILSAIALNRWLAGPRKRIFFSLACAIGCLAICLTLLFPPKARADDITRIAPVVEANSSPNQRILIYTYEDGRTDYLYQYLWYGSRYAQLPSSLNDLAATLLRSETATVIIDKESYKRLLPLMAGKAPKMLGQSENLICFRMP